MFSLFKSSKSHYYQILYLQPSGKRSTVSTKTKVKSEALKFLMDFKEKVTLKPVIKPITLEELQTIYLNYASMKFSKHYVRSSKSSLRIMLNYFSIKKLLKDISASALEAFFLQRYNESKSGAHLNYRTLKAILQKAVEWNYLSSNPIKSIKMPKLPHNNVQYIIDENFRKILNEETSTILKNIYEFAKGTGLRLAEITNLCWDQIDWNENLIKVKNTNEFQTKSKKERIIPMSAKIKEILLERKFNILPDRTNKYVFAKPGDIKYSEEFISKRFKKCVKMVNVNPEYHFHNLRSSFACDLIKKGVSIFVVQKLLGHSSVSTTERNYAHLQTEALKQAISLI